MKLATFGEVLIRLSSESNQPFSPTEKAGFYFGGSELNVALTLKYLGVQTSWISALPTSELGDWVLDQVQKRGIETHVDRLGNHMAVYFVEKGSHIRSSYVLERIPGPLSLEREAISWKELLKDSTHFHTTGISANLSEGALKDVEAALGFCRENKIHTSYDFNFRERLAPLELAKKRQLPFIHLVDTLFGGEKDLSSMLELDIIDSLETKEQWLSVKETLYKKYDFKQVILSQRKEEAGHEYYRVVGLTSSAVELSPWLIVSDIERIGMGDAMTAGFLYAQSKDLSLLEKVTLAAQCATLKSTIKGDFAELTPRMLDLYFDNQNSWR